MKVVILAGGLGTRLSEETEVRPKPMVEIGGRPIIWHIMKHLAHYGLREFVVALGYKGESIKRYFVDHFALDGPLLLDGEAGTIRRQSSSRDDWKVHLVDTGATTNTGGRLRRLRAVLGNEPFMVTYGDGVSDVDPTQVIAFHKKLGRAATVTAVRPPARYGALYFEGPLVRFNEKPRTGEGWINGGYIMMNPRALELIPRDDTSLEAELLERLAERRELSAYQHEGFWQCMDTLRDKRLLENLWQAGNAPWQVWEEQ